MPTEEDLQKLIDKVNKAKKDNKLDLSSDEDLSIGIMNLIGIEEHLFFTAQKTNKDVYLGLLKEVREMRVQLLKKIIKEYEGEVWCISKHLLSASMRLMEVGTKSLAKGEGKEAKDMFNKAYDLYSMFWALNLNLIDTKAVKDANIVPKDLKKEDEIDIKSTVIGDRNFMSKIKELIKKAIDCCKE